MRSPAVFVIAVLAGASLQAQDMPLSEVLVPGEAWTKAADRKAATSLAADAKGDVYFTDPFEKKVLKLQFASGTVAEYATTPDRPWSVAIHPDGRVCVDQNRPRNGETPLWGIVARNANGGWDTVVELLELEQLSFTISPRGEFYYATTPRVPPLDFGGIWRVSKIGDQPRHTEVTETMRPHLAFLPDGGTLVSTNSNDNWLITYTVEKDGSLSNREDYFGPLQTRSRSKGGGVGASQMQFDTDGRLYVATGVGVQIFDRTGRLCGQLLGPPGPCMGLCFAGPDRNVLYMSTGQALYRRRVQTKGVHQFK